VPRFRRYRPQTDSSTAKPTVRCASMTDVRPPNPPPCSYGNVNGREGGVLEGTHTVSATNAAVPRVAFLRQGGRCGLRAEPDVARVQGQQRAKTASYAV